MAYIIDVANAKGGVGKTTTTANVGASLAALGRRVLLVDTDPQASLTVVCDRMGMALQTHRHLWALLEQLVEGKTPPPVVGEHIVSTTGYNGVWLLPATLDLLLADSRLLEARAREYFLRELLEQVEDEYDYILLDSKPALGILPTNGLVAAQWVLLPMQAEEMAKQGLAIMLNDMLEVRRRLNRQLQVLGVVLTLYNERHKVDRQILAEMEAAVSGAGQYFFHTVIPERQELVQASGARKAVRVFRPDGTAARAYDALALEIMQRVGDPAGQDVAPQKETEVQDE